MKPIIGICANYSNNDEVGKLVHLGGALQEWQLIANDYICSIELAGGIPIVIPLFNDKHNAIELLKTVDGIVFTGGNDIDPQRYGQSFTMDTGEICVERDEQELALAKHIISETSLPFLAICRGIQLVNVAMGGSLYQNINKPGMPNHFAIAAPLYHAVHKVIIESNSLLNDIINASEVMTNSFHHQAIKDVATTFNVTARSTDGIIEAIETKDERFGLGLQWHPEMMANRNEAQLNILRHFVAACTQYRFSN